MTTRFLYVLRHAGPDRIDVREIFDEILTTVALDLPVTVVFLDQSVISLAAENSAPAALLAELEALAFYGVEQILVEQESLHERCLQLPEAALAFCRLIPRQAIPALMAGYERVFVR